MRGAIEGGAFRLAVAAARLVSSFATEAAALLRELGDESRPIVTRAVDELTRREVEVLRLLGEGLTNAEIAGRLGFSEPSALTSTRSMASDSWKCARPDITRSAR